MNDRREASAPESPTEIDGKDLEHVAAGASPTYQPVDFSEVKNARSRVSQDAYCVCKPGWN